VRTERIDNAQYTGDCNFSLQYSASLEGILEVSEFVFVLLNLGIGSPTESVPHGPFPWNRHKLLACIV